MALADLTCCLYLDLYCQLFVLVHRFFALFLLGCCLKSLPSHACQKAYACLVSAFLAALCALKPSLWGSTQSVRVLIECMYANILQYISSMFPK